MFKLKINLKIFLLLSSLFFCTIHTKKNNPIQQHQTNLTINPFNHTILFMLANEYFKANQTREAILQYKKIVGRNPNNKQALFNLGLSFLKLNNLEEAKNCFKQVVEIDPHNTTSFLSISSILVKQNRIDEAIKQYKKTIESNPKCIEAYKQLADTLKRQEKCHCAIHYYKKALELDPQNIPIIFNLGNTYLMLGQSQNAIAQFKKVEQKQPNNYTIKHNIGYSYRNEGRVDQAIKYYKKALEINPKYEGSIYGRALALLYKGDFKNGWEAYAWRLKKEKRNAEKLRKWIKENNVQGKKIHLMPEGGIGDTIQFFRYVEVLQNMGADLTISVQKPLIPLLSNCPYIKKPLLNAGQLYKINYEDRASIMSLPAIFESTEETIPKNIPYITPDKKLDKKWKTYFKNNKKIKVGFCWEADVKNDVSRLPVARRSIPLIALEKLSHIPNIEFYSLQKSDGSSEIDLLPEHFVVTSFGPDFDDKSKSGPFMDTAAIMKHLDLIITVDTSVAHLAGALGKPVWVMLPYNTDWRWIVNRTDSPWYPTMKLFKQPSPFDWKSVVDNIFEELNNMQKSRQTT